MELKAEYNAQEELTCHRILVLVDKVFIKVLLDQFFGLFR